MRRQKKDPVGYADFHTPTKTDIVAQTIDKIKADIVAQTIDKIKTDLVAQTIESLDIDLYAQTIGEVTIRPKFGAAAFKWVSATVPPADEPFLIEISAKGTFFFAWLRIASGTKSHTTSIAVELDGTQIHVLRVFSDLKNYGYVHNSWWQQLIKYAENGECVYQLVPPSGVSFEETLKIKARNPTDYSQTMGGCVVYSTI